MQADTIIQYGSDGSYKILQGGELPEGVVNENGLTSTEQAIADRNYQIAIAMAGDKSNINKVEDKKPQTGLKVIYDGEGFIKDYKFLYTTFAALDPGTTSPVGTYTWGSFNNTLKVTSTTVTGTGRLSTFSDVIGDHDNNLVKGDVATRGDKDNPKSGTIISVSAYKKDTKTIITKDMTKNDNGGLPNAILDIWKTGVEYWGYTWTSTLSIEDGSGSYTYTR